MDLQNLLAFLPADLFQYVTIAIAVAAALATSLPKPVKAGSVYSYIYNVINFVALNFGKAKNL